MYKIYGDNQSGNCYKVKLLMHLLDLEYEWIDVDILASDTQTTEFKDKNENAKIPVLEIGESEYLAESNAILNFLAEGTNFLPKTGIERAKVLQWQFFEQYSHEPYIAVARFINKYLGLPEDKKEAYAAKQSGGHKALAVMEHQLSRTAFLIGSSPSIADISLYAYTHVAHEGGFDLIKYPNIQAWLSLIESLPRYIAMAD